MAGNCIASSPACVRHTCRIRTPTQTGRPADQATGTPGIPPERAALALYRPRLENFTIFENSRMLSVCLNDRPSQDIDRQGDRAACKKA